MPIPTPRRGTAVQINTYPMDVRHVADLLPHQMRVWHDLVDSVVITLDVHRTRSGRYRGTQYAENLESMRDVLAQQMRDYPKLKVIETDYSPEAMREVAGYFFGAASMPPKAWDGGPFYTYFFGLHSTGARYVMHFDSDMLFGGGSRTWLTEAIDLLERNADVLLIAPFPGPPRADRAIFGHQQSDGYSHAPEPLPSPAYRFNYLSSRCFLLDMGKFEERIGKLPRLAPSPAQRLKARLLGNPPEALEAETLLSRTMMRAKLTRIDLLGSPPGMWSLHPPYRSETFYDKLPQIVAAVERGDIPEGQRGHFDIRDCFVDLSDARAAASWHNRLLRHVRHRLSAPHVD
jgi:hypothetical protein